MSDDRWRAIETAPKDGSPCLVFDDGEIAIAGQIANGTWRCFAGKWLAMNANAAPVFMAPTHWQPLPEPPQ